MCGDRRIGFAQRLAALPVGDEVVDQRLQCGTVDRPREVEVRFPNEIDAPRRASAGCANRGDLRNRHPPLARDLAEASNGLLDTGHLTGPIRRSDRLDQALRIAGLFAPIALEDGARILVAAERLEQPQQAKKRIPAGGIGAQRLAVFGHRAVVVAELHGGFGDEFARGAVVGPEFETRLECVDRLAGLSASQQQATAQEVRNHRIAFEFGNDLLGLVVVARSNQQIDVLGEHQRRTLPHQRHPLRHGVRGLCELVALFVVLRESVPGLVIVHAVFGRSEQQPLGLLGLPGVTEPIGEGVDENQVSGLGFDGATQDLGYASRFAHLAEEFDSGEYDHLLRRKLLQAIVPKPLGGFGVSLLLHEGCSAPADPRFPIEPTLQILDGSADL